MILIIFYIPFIVLFVSIAIFLCIQHNKFKLKIQQYMVDIIDFNEFLSYRNNHFYVKDKKCNNFKQMTLYLQQELGSINEDDVVVNNLNDISC